MAVLCFAIDSQPCDGASSSVSLSGGSHRRVGLGGRVHGAQILGKGFALLAVRTRKNNETIHSSLQSDILATVVSTAEYNWAVSTTSDGHKSSIMW